ncbi:MAG: T9SS type A sorting domain-containing protein [Bacteroidota bacterium]
MKKLLLLSTSLLILTKVNAQVVADTVSLGAGYTNQKWYSLENDEQGTSPKNNWDIAFDVSGFGSSIHINSVTGTMLWKYSSADTAGWATIDTTGIATWPALYNSDTSWALGAFDKGIILSNSFDLGWGVYNPTNHITTGDSLFVIKLAGGTYKKLWIEQLGSATYSFRYADLNGGNLQVASILKSTYAGKNFGYYSLQSNTELSREPISADWDFSFMQYTTFLPTPYGVTGIIANKGVEVAQANNINNVAAYADWNAHTYVSKINEIGYDWKAFTGTAYAITDSLIYFVKTNAGDIWKVIPTGFGGGANGNCMFTKQKISSVSITDINEKNNATMAVYPNPSAGENITLVYNFERNSPFSDLTILDVMGKTVYTDKLNGKKGLHQYQFSLEGLNAGIYFVTINSNGSRLQQKLIIQ